MPTFQWIKGAVNVDQVVGTVVVSGALGAMTGTSPVSGSVTIIGGSLFVTGGSVSVSFNNTHVLNVVAGTSNHPLLPAGGTTTAGTGSYLSHLIVMQQVFTTVGSCAIYIADNTGGTAQVHGTVIAGSAGLNADVSQREIQLGVISRLGPWRITTQPGVAVAAVGKFL